ncbi:MAG: SDR family oxidoreductase [SAR324 cluster bacterium]|nr:SDR family oxidoreductase [SAR324 cluster bacterium]
MKIMVVGGGGYIGTSLIPRLLEWNHEVEVVDLLWFGSFLPEGVPVTCKDALDLAESDFEGFDVLIFLGGLSNDPMAEFSPRTNFVFNAATPAYLAYIAKRAGVKRFIYSCTCSVYGYAVDELYDEDAHVSCSYPYGLSKLQGEQAVLQLIDENFSVISLRKGTVGGHSPRMRFDLVVNTMFKSAVVKKEVTINNAAIWRPILGVRDCVNAYIRVVEAPQNISGIFNIISGNHTIGELGEIVKTEMERLLGPKISLNIKNIQDYRNYKVSFDKATRILNYQPRDTIESLVQDLVAHREEYGDFSNPQYYNIEVLKNLDLGNSPQAFMKGQK